MNLSKLIEIYKGKRKQAMLDNISLDLRMKYACVGVGQHSLSTLYPILTFLQAPVKYILTQKSNFGEKIALKFPGAKATHLYEDILEDPEIAGIFISAAPKAHSDLCLRALKKNKHVFIEKPVCYSRKQLLQLLSICKTNCIVGLQKRHSKINEILKRKYPSPKYYSYRYALGNYPEGNPVYELFIHPIDNVVFLFGAATVSSLKKIKNKDGLVYILQLDHSSGVFGMLELSTNHHWSEPIDSMRLEMTDAEIKVEYPAYIESTSKGTSLIGIPLNKVLRRPTATNVIYKNTGSIHSLDRNILYEAGYFNQIKEFISRVEGVDPNTCPSSSIENLLDTYELLDYVSQHL